MTTKLTGLRLGLAAGTAALATAAVLAASGSAQAPSSTTLHFVSKTQNGVGFFPRHAPRQGDRFGFGDRVSGDDTGFDRGVCTVIRGGMLCTAEIQLSRGSLSAQGLVPQRSRDTPIAIIGGTGAYDGARGTAFVTDVDEKTTEITVTLLP